MSYRIAAALPALSLLLLSAPPALAQAVPASTRSGPAVSEVSAEEVAAVRAATEKYADVEVALADGYVRHPVCVVAQTEGQPSQLGGMGYHYFRPDLLGITEEQPRVNGVGTHTDWLQPAILLYEPQADGSLELTAIENLVWVKAWHEAGNEGPPEFHGNQYYHMIDNPDTPVDEAHGFQPHYELHWWLYRDNPAGTFAPFNATISCQYATEAHAMH
jgi:hypothetical protein